MSSPPAFADPDYRRRVALSWLPTLLWIAAIMLFSSALFSSDNTAGMLERLLRWIFDEMSRQQIRWLNHVIRKSAHVGAYAVLGLTAFFAWRMTLPRKHWLAWSALALLLCLGVASGDEYNQSLQRQRTGSVRDVALDLSGAALAQGLLLGWGAARRRPENKG